MARSLIVGLSCSLLGVLPAAVAQRTPDVRLNTHPPGVSYAGTPEVAASGSSVYAVWADSRNGSADIYFNASTDSGATWQTSDVRLDTDPPGAAKSRRPRIAAFGSAVYVVWMDERSGAEAIYFNRSLDGGQSWLSSDVRLDNPRPKIPGSPQIAASGSAVYVTWSDGGFGSPDVWFNRSLDGGTTWLPAAMVLNTVGPAAGPQIAASGRAVYIVWEEDRNGQLDIYFDRSVDRGTTWLGAQVRLDTDPAGAAHSFAPAMVVMGGSVYVTWIDQRNGVNGRDVYFNGSIDSGTTWRSSDVRLNTDPPGTVYCGPPRMATTGSSVYVTWDRGAGRTSDVHLNHSQDAGATWLASDLRLNTGPPASSGSSAARIAASGSSVYVAWEDSRNAFPLANPDVYINYSTNGGATWLSSDVRLNTNPPGSSWSVTPAVVALAESALVAWSDRRSGTSDIYANLPFAQLPYGVAKAGSGGLAPRLAGSGLAVRASVASIDVDNALGGASGAVLIGAGPASMTSTPLFGGTLLVLPALAMPIALGGPAGVAGAGTASLPLSIPAVPALGGQNLNFQVFVLDGAATFGLSMTNAVEMWIG